MYGRQPLYHLDENGLSFIGQFRRSAASARHRADQIQCADRGIRRNISEDTFMRFMSLERSWSVFTTYRVGTGDGFRPDSILVWRTIFAKMADKLERRCLVYR